MKIAATLLRLFELLVFFVTHAVLFASTYWVVTLGLASERSDLARIHVITSTLALGLLMLEGVFCVSGDVVLRNWLTRPQRVKVHLVLEVLGVLFFIISMATIEANKQRQGMNHFTTNHGILGGASFAGSIAVTIGGLMLMGGDKVLPRGSIWHFKILHSFLGQASVIVGLASLITGVYNGWMGSDDITNHILAASFGFTGFVTMVKPCFELVGKIRARTCS